MIDSEPRYYRRTNSPRLIALSFAVVLLAGLLIVGGTMVYFWQGMMATMAARREHDRDLEEKARLEAEFDDLVRVRHIVLKHKVAEMVQSAWKDFAAANGFDLWESMEASQMVIELDTKRRQAEAEHAQKYVGGRTLSDLDAVRGREHERYIQHVDKELPRWIETRRLGMMLELTKIKAGGASEIVRKWHLATMIGSQQQVVLYESFYKIGSFQEPELGAPKRIEANE